MLRYLLQRPIAVLLSFFLLCLLGLAALRMLPISLLPDADVPQIMVKVAFPGMAAEAMEDQIIRPLRDNLSASPGLKDIESQSANGLGLLHLTFEYQTRMDLAYIEVNERIDRMLSRFPRDMPRPQAMRINTSDIPIIRLQIIPKMEEDFGAISQLTDKIIRRKLEQLEGVSLVDIHGLQHTEVWIKPNISLLQTLRSSESAIERAIQSAKSDLGSLQVQDGHYRYAVKASYGLEEAENIGALPVRLTNGYIVPLSEIASVQNVESQPEGYHLYNGKPAIGVTIQKQASARMNELVPRIRQEVEALRLAYPQADFELTQDQSFLLQAGISNLWQVLLFGGILAVFALFMFIGHYRSGFLMGLSIPVSLLLTFALFQGAGISLNILSLSGLALGLGMLIDNAIIVLDNITRKRSAGLTLLDSCDTGVREVSVPVLSHVLTSVAVYGPLVLLPGLAGALIFDQALALTISLGISLLVAFLLIPMLYKLLQREQSFPEKEDTQLYRWVLNGYHRFLAFAMQRRYWFLAGSAAFALSGIYALTQLPVSGLPYIRQQETLLRIDWQAPLTAQENLRRMQQVDQLLAPVAVQREAEIGVLQYALQTEDQTAEQAQVYYACAHPRDKQALDRRVREWLQRHYPEAAYTLEDAPNAFTQLFASRRPYFEARLKPAGSSAAQGSPHEYLTEAMRTFPIGGAEMVSHSPRNPIYRLSMDSRAMAAHRISSESLREKLHFIFGQTKVHAAAGGTEEKTFRLSPGASHPEQLLQEHILAPGGYSVPLSALVSIQRETAAKYILADKSGPYTSIQLGPGTAGLDATAPSKISAWALQQGYEVQFGGRFFEARQEALSLAKIFLITLLLLYLILALQFNHLLQPLAVIATISFGIAGAAWVLYILRIPLDVMAGVGFIIVLGIIVDDPILKVEVINRLRKTYEQEGCTRQEAFAKALYRAGAICLKPLLMTSLTTCLALTPVLFAAGIGADLQKPLACVVIGGLSIGTFFATWFIPLVYSLLIKSSPST